MRRLLISELQIVDDGRPTRSGFIQGVLRASPGVILTDDKHGLEDGDIVEIDEV